MGDAERACTGLCFQIHMTFETMTPSSIGAVKINEEGASNIICTAPSFIFGKNISQTLGNTTIPSIAHHVHDISAQTKYRYCITNSPGICRLSQMNESSFNICKMFSMKIMTA